MNTGRIFVYVLLSATLLLSAGCGYNPDKPVYDTAKNPYKFPQDALDLINDIEAGKLMTYESVADRFEALYGKDMSLLDNHEWAEVVSKLGSKFRVWADSLANEGLSKYYQAAGLYALASFARPEDRRTMDDKELFETWRDAVDSGSPAALFLDPETVPTLEERIEIAKEFLLSDSLHRAFAIKYVIGPMFVSEGTDWLRPQALQQLRAADQAFLDYAGLAQFSFESPLVRFDSGKIDLIDCIMTPVDSFHYRVEAYFIPRDSITQDIGVVFRIQAPASTPYTVEYDGRDWSPYDFSTLTPSTTWKVDSVAPAVETLYYSGAAQPTLIGLVVLDQNNPRPLPVDSGGIYFELPASVFPDDTTKSIR